jgi:hypothetical protein
MVAWPCGQSLYIERFVCKHLGSKLGRGARERTTETERESREMANCFGDIVDNYKLDTMPRYVGKTKTREKTGHERPPISIMRMKSPRRLKSACV